MPILSFDTRRVVVSLGAQPKTELELIKALDMRPLVVRGCVEELIALDLVHVVAYNRERGNSQLIATYAAGSKVRPLARRRRPKSVARMETPAR